jgi:hypothetical protein
MGTNAVERKEDGGTLTRVQKQVVVVPPVESMEEEFNEAVAILHVLWYKQAVATEDGGHRMEIDAELSERVRSFLEQARKRTPAQPDSLTGIASQGVSLFEKVGSSITNWAQRYQEAAAERAKRGEEPAQLKNPGITDDEQLNRHITSLNELYNNISQLPEESLLRIKSHLEDVRHVLNQKLRTR